MFIEIKDENGNDVVPPITLSKLEITRDSDDYFDPLSENPENRLIQMGRTGGRLNMKFFGDSSGLVDLLPTDMEDHIVSRRYNIHVKQGFERDASSYNIFKNCFIAYFTWEPIEIDTDGDIIEISIGWRFSDSEIILSLPHELEETEDDTVTLVGNNLMWERNWLPSFYQEKSESLIQSLDWRQIGF